MLATTHVSTLSPRAAHDGYIRVLQQLYYECTYSICVLRLRLQNRHGWREKAHLIEFIDRESGKHRCGCGGKHRTRGLRQHYSRPEVRLGRSEGNVWLVAACMNTLSLLPCLAEPGPGANEMN